MKMKIDKEALKSALNVLKIMTFGALCGTLGILVYRKLPPIIGETVTGIILAVLFIFYIVVLIYVINAHSNAEEEKREEERKLEKQKNDRERVFDDVIRDIKCKFSIGYFQKFAFLEKLKKEYIEDPENGKEILEVVRKNFQEYVDAQESEKIIAKQKEK